MGTNKMQDWSSNAYAVITGYLLFLCALVGLVLAILGDADLLSCLVLFGLSAISHSLGRIIEILETTMPRR